MITFDQPSCLICADPVFERCLPCNCVVCAPCISEWLTAEIQEHFLTGENFIRCPNAKCHDKFSIYLLLSSLPHKHHHHLANMLLKNYIQETPDVINCQKASCHYYGVMPSKDCPNDLICELCGHKWKEKSQMTTLEKVWGRISNAQETFNEVQTVLYQILFTVQCTKCGIPIRKAGGCNHMTCKKCAHEFCWTCKQDFSNHSLELCAVNSFVKLLVVLFFVFQVLIITGPYHMLWNMITGGIGLFLKVCFFNMTFLAFMLVLFPLVGMWKERYGSKKKLLWYTLWFVAMAYVTIQNIPYLIYNYIGEMIWALCTEIFLIFIICFINFIIQTWLKFVL